MPILVVAEGLLVNPTALESLAPEFIQLLFVAMTLLSPICKFSGDSLERERADDFVI